MEKIIRIMSSIEHDKLLHSFYGTLLFALMLIVVPVWTAFVVVVVVAIMKEVHDQWKYKGFDWKDIVATIIVPLVFVMVL